MAFTGRAVYGGDGTNTIFGGIWDDVSDIISIISPTETPLLDALAQAERAAANVYHEWLEDALTPDTVVCSVSMVNTTAATAIAVHTNGVGAGRFIPAGTLMKNQTSGEFVLVGTSTANTLVVTRAVCSTTIATILAGDIFTVIAANALEGADVDTDISRPRKRVGNYCQIMKRDVIISGTMQAVSNIGVSSEWDLQVQRRTAEALRDLEKAVILSRTTGNTIGSSTAYRTMQGLWAAITTNATSIATLSAAVLDDVIQGAWSTGASDLDLIVADPTWKRAIDQWNASRVEISNTDETHRNRVSYFAGSFGEFPVIMSRYMPAKSAMVISTNRVRVVPLQGREFHFEEVAKTGDSLKGMVIGEYTLEYKNEEGMAKVYG